MTLLKSCSFIETHDWVPIWWNNFFNINNVNKIDSELHKVSVNFESFTTYCGHVNRFSLPAHGLGV